MVIAQTLNITEQDLVNCLNIVTGVYSPLEGFLKESDYISVLQRTRLEDGTLWPIPIVLSADRSLINAENSQNLILTYKKEDEVYDFLLKNIEIYDFSKKKYAENIFKTNDAKHPGVKMIYEMGNCLIGGKLTMLKGKINFKTPQEIRDAFRNRGWNTITAFQTRNIPHAGHHFLQTKALDITDGLLVHPVLGKKKAGDSTDEQIMASYNNLIDEYHPAGRVMLTGLHLTMQYAGPKEAILHAIIRQNYGCTHFIVGRDHAGAGDYYGPYDAQDIFNEFKNDLKIEILKFEEIVVNTENNRLYFKSECPEKAQMPFSGSGIRDCIEKGEWPSPSIIFPEIVAPIMNQKWHQYYDTHKQDHPGAVMWLTGLSQAGKSTIANLLYQKLKQKNFRVERLDGDVIRETLTKDLGFSKKDRGLNIERISFVARLLSRNNTIVIASFISPYAKIREKVRLNTMNFIEVFVDTPIGVCEQRDTKGLYKLAKEGTIKNFTGISDPYEAPVNPEIRLDTTKSNPEECIEIILEYLTNNLPR